MKASNIQRDKPRGCVLIVDDQEDVLDLLIAVMESGDEDLKVKGLRNGVEALLSIGERKPDLLILDEPTTGVDPVSRRDFWKILSSLLKSGITIVASTPYLDEAERSTRVALMDRGSLLICDSPQAIKASFHSDIIEVVCDRVREAVEILLKSLEKKDIQMFGDRLHIVSKNAKREEADILKKLKNGNLDVKSSRVISPSLEDVFIASMKS